MMALFDTAKAKMMSVFVTSASQGALLSARRCGCDLQIRQGEESRHPRDEFRHQPAGKAPAGEKTQVTFLLNNQKRRSGYDPERLFFAAGLFSSAAVLLHHSITAARYGDSAQ